MPILFPPNRIEDGQFTYKENTYKFPINEMGKFNHIHGLLHDKPWRVCKKEVNGNEIVINTEFSSSDFTNLKGSFPQDITVNMSLSLMDDTLDIQLEITNKGIEPFPWGAGYHTVFNFPFGPGSKMEDCRISLPVNKQWELNERSLPTGEIHETANTLEIQNGFSLEGRRFDDLLAMMRKVLWKTSVFSLIKMLAYKSFIKAINVLSFGYCSIRRGSSVRNHIHG